MAVTISAVIFLALLLAVAFLGTRMMQKKSVSGTPGSERCLLCSTPFPKAELVTRQIGDYKIVYFCRSCIIKLYADAGTRN